MQRPLVPRGPMTQLKMSDIVISFQFKITLLIQKVGKQNRRQNMSYVGGGEGGERQVMYIYFLKLLIWPFS